MSTSILELAWSVSMILASKANVCQMLCPMLPLGPFIVINFTCSTTFKISIIKISTKLYGEHIFINWKYVNIVDHWNKFAQGISWSLGQMPCPLPLAKILVRCPWVVNGMVTCGIDWSIIYYSKFFFATASATNKSCTGIAVNMKPLMSMITSWWNLNSVLPDNLGQMPCPALCPWQKFWSDVPGSSVGW